ncbi:MAG TPA: SAM-dependent methyltransferase [Syntrophorhabdaceae bacterium]|nr:SAM-dependent methyltransferase [Syntrophorhabdaceae bacterium]
MKENQVSYTARWCAYARAHHVMNDNPKVFDDYLAPQIITDEDRAEYDQSLGHLMAALQFMEPARAASFTDRHNAVTWIMQGMYPSALILSRARYTEDKLMEAINQGVTQYVILGAGLDTFAFRHPELVDRLQVFEVDYPSMQAFKRHRLAELGWQAPAQLHFVPMDFAQDNLMDALRRSSFDPKALSLFSWLGVTYYLEREEVFATFRTVTEATSAGSVIVFDYLDTDIFRPYRVARRVRVLLTGARKRGEPMKCAFEPDELAADLKPLHLRVAEDLGPSEVQQRYFEGRTDAHYACEHAHIARAIVE